MLFVWLTSSMLAASPSSAVSRAFDTADLASCLQLTAHPEDPLRVSLVTHPDGGWTIALDDADHLPADTIYDCLTAATGAVLRGLTFAKVPSVFVRTVGNPDTMLNDAFEAKRASIAACVLARLPTSEPEFHSQQRLSRDASGALHLTSLDDAPRFAKELTTCVKTWVRATPGPATTDVELQVVRPRAMPRHDGTAGAVCSWADPTGKPTPKACRAGLACTRCVGNESSEPVDVTCVRPCGPVP